MVPSPRDLFEKQSNFDRIASSPIFCTNHRKLNFELRIRINLIWSWYENIENTFRACSWLKLWLQNSPQAANREHKFCETKVTKFAGCFQRFGKPASQMHHLPPMSDTPHNSFEIVVSPANPAKRFAEAGSDSTDIKFVFWIEFLKNYPCRNWQRRSKQTAQLSRQNRDHLTKIFHH